MFGAPVGTDPLPLRITQQRPTHRIEHRLHDEPELIGITQRRLGSDELLLERRQLERLVDVDHARHGNHRAGRRHHRPSQGVTHEVDAARRAVIDKARGTDHGSHVVGHRREVVRRGRA